MKEVVKLAMVSSILGLYIWVIKRMGREIDETDWTDIID